MSDAFSPVEPLATVVRVIGDHRPGHTTHLALDSSTPLFDGGLEFDSIGLLDALLAIEEAVGTTLAEEQLADADLTDIGSIATLFS